MEVLSYGYYTSSYGGNLIPASSWQSYMVKIEARIERYTFGRLCEPWTNKIKTAACEMAECLYKFEKRDGKTSENIDGYSVAFDTSQSIDSMLYDIAQVYLENTGLMDLAVNVSDY